MKIAFNARLLHGENLRGWNRYLVNLLVHLPALGVAPLLYTDQPIHGDHRKRLPAEVFPDRLSPPMRYFRWEQNWLGQQCARDKVDILHCPLNFGLPRKCPCPRVLTLHDAIGQVYQAPKTPLRERLSPATLRSTYSHWIARRSAERIITVSQHAKGDLVNRLRLPAERIAVTYEAAEERFHEPISPEKRERVKQTYRLNLPYVLYLGGWERRKNVPFLVRAFAAAALGETELVLVGGKNAERASLQQLADSLGIGQRLRLVGWADDADLPALYAGALCFVYPSEYEGFGLQLCEAMSAGCPTLAADATCLPEVLGGGGEVFTLADTSMLTAKLRRIAAEPAFRDQLIERARTRAMQFSWQRTAEQTVALYRELLA